MEKYYYVERIPDLLGIDEDEIYYLEFEYGDIDDRSFLLRTSGYRGKTYHKVRVTSNDTVYACDKVGKMLELLDMVYNKITIQTFKFKNYIELEDINDMYVKLIRNRLIKKFEELSKDEVETVKILKGELDETENQKNNTI